MKNGRVEWFNDNKGYGFILPDDDSGDVFVHLSALKRSGLNYLPEGAKISFDIVEEKGKESAINLRIIT